MTHDELLAIVKDKFINQSGLHDAQIVNALYAVVELHKPIETYNINNVHKSWLTCNHCDDEVYPCPTILLIEKELK